MPASGSASIAELHGISHTFGQTTVLHDVSLNIGAGEFFTLLGPSGCGKTTLLRILAGLQEVQDGQVLINGADMRDVPPHRRDIGVVFQNLALFPHMTVGENIAFSLRMRGIGKDERRKRVSEALEAVRLPHLESRQPSELSGGQRQRVAIARALVFRPPLLLLDEPLAALDRRLKEEMQLELIRLHRDMGVAIVNVTHDQREALRVSDRLAVMHRGRLHQVGTPEEVYAAPSTPEVAAFLGEPSLLEGRVEATPEARMWTNGRVRVPVPADTATGDAILTLRSESLLLRPDSTGARAAGMPVVVELAAFEGDGRFYQVRGADGPAIAVFESGTSEGLAAGDRGWLSWDPRSAPLVRRTPDGP